MKVKVRCKDQGGQGAEQEVTGALRGQGTDGGGQAVLRPLQCPVGPQRDPEGEAALTLEGSASPRHDVLDKGWERRRKSATALGPSQPLKPLLPALYRLTSNLPNTLSSEHDSFPYLGLMGRRWKEGRDITTALCPFSVLVLDTDEMSYIISANPRNLGTGASITPLLR